MIERVCDPAVAVYVFGHSGFAQGSTATQDRVAKIPTMQRQSRLRRCDHLGPLPGMYCVHYDKILSSPGPGPLHITRPRPSAES